MISNENANTAGLEIEPRIATLFERASREIVKVTLDTAAQAESLRFKLHHVRKQMRRHNHPLLTRAEAVTFRVRNNILTAQPSNDAKFHTAIEKALKTVEGKKDVKSR